VLRRITGPEREEAAGDCRKLHNGDLTIYTARSPERAPVKGYPAVCNWPSDEAALLRATKKKHPKGERGGPRGKKGVKQKQTHIFGGEKVKVNLSLSSPSRHRGWARV
jgi:hypothetical protein